MTDGPKRSIFDRLGWFGLPVLVPDKSGGPKALGCSNAADSQPRTQCGAVRISQP
jgi:hypothetical protein